MHEAFVSWGNEDGNTAGPLVGMFAETSLPGEDDLGDNIELFK